jgi:hypothetical protein
MDIDVSSVEVTQGFLKAPGLRFKDEPGMLARPDRQT